MTGPPVGAAMMQAEKLAKRTAKFPLAAERQRRASPEARREAGGRREGRKAVVATVVPAARGAAATVQRAAVLRAAVLQRGRAEPQPVGQQAAAPRTEAGKPEGLRCRAVPE